VSIKACDLSEEEEAMRISREKKEKKSLTGLGFVELTSNNRM